MCYSQMNDFNHNLNINFNTQCPGVSHNTKLCKTWPNITLSFKSVCSTFHTREGPHASDHVTT